MHGNSSIIISHSASLLKDSNDSSAKKKAKRQWIKLLTTIWNLSDSLKVCNANMASNVGLLKSFHVLAWFLILNVFSVGVFYYKETLRILIFFFCNFLPNNLQCFGMYRLEHIRTQVIQSYFWFLALWQSDYRKFFVFSLQASLYSLIVIFHIVSVLKIVLNEWTFFPVFLI